MVWLNVIAISIQDRTVPDIPDVPVLTGPRVTLRAPTIDDAEPLFERIASDPEVTRFLSWTPHPNVAETRRVITEFFNVGAETTWLIELHDGTGPVGLCGWRRHQPHTVELGYCLGRQWWRKGIMSEVLQLLIEKARNDPNVYRVTAHCHVDNTGSAAVLERSGLNFEGRIVRYAVLPNISTEPQDCLLFGKAPR
jgi:RimJ/RimL family protein N-acetyltransferase